MPPTASAPRAVRSDDDARRIRLPEASAPAASAPSRRRPRRATLEPVYFDFNESVLTTEATAAIDRDAECIKKTNHGVTLTGRTDPRGTEEYNLALSDKRAQQVKGRMGQLGVTTDMKINARGEMDATGKDEAGWAKDRRVDVAW